MLLGGISSSFVCASFASMCVIWRGGCGAHRQCVKAFSESGEQGAETVTDLQ